MTNDLQNYYLLDVRDEYEFEQKSIEGSNNIPYRMIMVAEVPGSIGFYLKKIPKNKIILLYCSSGKRARLAERVLSSRGYEVMNILTFSHAEDYVKSLRAVKS